MGGWVPTGIHKSINPVGVPAACCRRRSTCMTAGQQQGPSQRRSCRRRRTLQPTSVEPREHSTLGAVATARGLLLLLRSPAVQLPARLVRGHTATSPPEAEMEGSTKPEKRMVDTARLLQVSDDGCMPLSLPRTCGDKVCAPPWVSA
eukprot:SAG25_NODE_167_length_13063_cov_9.799830_2_plen_147_part_00